MPSLPWHHKALLLLSLLLHLLLFCLCWLLLQDGQLSQLLHSTLALAREYLQDDVVIGLRESHTTLLALSSLVVKTVACTSSTLLSSGLLAGVALAGLASPWLLLPWLLASCLSSTLPVLLTLALLLQPSLPLPLLAVGSCALLLLLHLLLLHLDHLNTVAKVLKNRDFGTWRNLETDGVSLDSSTIK